MKILSLFDGMACGMLAMLGAGVNVERYVAYEIDKYAIQTSSHNFPMIEHKGDVFNADFTEYKNFDFIVGGSPCTYWSIAQKNNRETEASGIGWELFSQYVRAVKEVQPKYFIYENNKSMSKAIKESISNTFGFEPVLVNSALVSAQNRQRLYWVGKRNSDGTYSKVNVEQPEDRGILLKDILETGCHLDDKSHCVISSCGRTTTREYFVKNQGDMCAEPVRVPPYGTVDKSRPCCALYPNHAGVGEGSLQNRMFSPNPNKEQVDLIAEPINTTKDGKASTVMSGYYKYGNATLITNEGFKGGANAVAEPVNTTKTNKSQTIKANYYKTGMCNYCCYTSTYGTTGVAEQVGALPRPNGELSTSQAFRVYSTDAKSVTLKGNAGGAGGKTGLYAVPCGDCCAIDQAESIRCGDNYIQYDLNGKGNDSQDQRVHFGNKMGTITSVGTESKIKVLCPMYAIPTQFDDEGNPTKAISYTDGKEYTVYKVESGQITIKGKQYPIKLVDGRYIIRKLTVRECMRLQTIPEWYEFPVSNSQAYKMIGNGWTVEVIVHLINSCLNPTEEKGQITLF